MQYKFHLNNLRMAPRKVRLIVNLIKKMPVLEAEAELKFQSKRAALPILKLLKSGIAAAVNNFNLLSDNLYIANIFIDEGSMLKRFRPRAFGRAGAIHKKTSNVTLILEEMATSAGAKKTKKKTVRKTERKEEEILEKKPSFIVKEAPREIKPRGKFEGIARKIFRRKAIG